MIKNKRILVSGGAGSIGSELVRQLAPQNKVFILDNNETGAFDLREELKQKGYWVHSRTGDIRDRDTLFDVFSDFKPQYIFHAAALKHVTPSEEYPEEVIETNIQGTWNVIREAKKWECLEKFVFVSTDKAVSSTTTMGASKRFGELMTINQGKKFVVVRFANVLGSRGSVIPIWERQMNIGEAVTITDEKMERYFMTIEEACDLVIQAGEMGKGGEIFILNMGKPVKIIEVAKQIIKDIRSESPIKIIGKRLGEQLTERLMFVEEEERAIKQGKFFIIK